MDVDRLLFQKIENRSVDHNENLKAGLFPSSAISRESFVSGQGRAPAERDGRSTLLSTTGWNPGTAAGS